MAQRSATCDVLHVVEDVTEKFLPSVHGVEVENGLEQKTKNGSTWATSRYTGILLAICSGFLFSSNGIIAKYLKDVHVLNLGIFRFMGMFLLALPLVLRTVIVQGKTIFTSIWPPTNKTTLFTILLLFGRAFIGFASITCYFLAVQRIPVADVSVLGSMSMVTVALLAHITLGEKCGLIPSLAAILTIGGIICIAKPPLITGQDDFDMDTLIGTGYALTRMLLATVAIVFVRKLRTVNSSLVVLVIGLLQLLQNGIAAIILGVFELPAANDFWTWGLLVGLGIFSFGSQMALTLALKCEEAGPFSVVKTASDTLAAFVLQFIIFDLIPDLFSIAGALIISFAVSLTVLRKWVGSLSEEDNTRKRAWLLLM